MRTIRFFSPSGARWLRGATPLAGAWLVMACTTVFDGELGPAIACQDEGGFGPPACPDDETCVTGSCVAVGAPLGGACKSDGDCTQPAICLDPEDVRQPGKKRCSRTCCTSPDCGDPRHGQICWSPPDGVGSVCWPAIEIERPAPGDRARAEECQEGAQCRSGLCVDGVCVDGCCDHSNCKGDEICRIKLVSELSEEESWTCGEPGSDADGSTCDSDDDCPSSRCVGELNAMVCVEPCCSSRECGERLIMGLLQRVACDVTGGLRGCSLLLPTSAIGGVGADCDDGYQCRSGQCLDGYCSDLCCNDADCGDVSVFSCVPAPLAGIWALRCVRK